MDDIWSAAKGVLGTVAPLLATAVGGPLAGAATGAIIKAIGLGPDTPPEQVAAAVQGATPEQLLALKKADQDFAVQMRQLDIGADQLVYGDKANARAREVSIKDKTPEILAVFVTIGFFGLLAMMIFRVLPDGNQTVLNIMTGALGAGWANMLSYYYGASAPRNQAQPK